MSAPTTAGGEALVPGPFRLTQRQYEYLIRAINPRRVRQSQGQSHVEAWDIRRTLIQIFGFGGFDIENRGITLVKEIEKEQGERSRWTVVYRVDLRLHIKDAEGRVIAFYDGTATGDAINMPSVGDAHDFALKTADSQALKRCATNLGDQFGLSLYNKGATEGVVVASLIRPATVQGAEAKLEDAPAVEGGEMDDQRDGDYSTPIGHGQAPAASSWRQEASPEEVAAARSANRRTVRQGDAPAAETAPAAAHPTGQMRYSTAQREAAAMLAKAALQSGDRNHLLGMRSQVKSQHLAEIHVHAAIAPAEAVVLELGDPPITLDVLVASCGRFVDAHKVSVRAAALTAAGGTR